MVPTCLYTKGCDAELWKVIVTYVATPMVIIGMVVTCAPCKVIGCLIGGKKGKKKRE